MTTRYICINGHDHGQPGRWLGTVLGTRQAIYECVRPGCRAEAEPVNAASTELTGHYVTHRFIYGVARDPITHPDHDETCEYCS